MSTDNVLTTNIFQTPTGTGCNLLKTGQTTSYHAGDDGDLEYGVAHEYEVLTTGQYAGTTDITINGKTLAMSNACVRDVNTGLYWAREVPQSDIGPATNGKLFWDDWTLENQTDISFSAATDIINSTAGDFNTSALCVGRKFAVVGSTHNSGIHTVASITANNITVVEDLIEESAGASVTIETTGDLIWDLADQANAGSLGGYNDWFVPNQNELWSIHKAVSPYIDTLAFPSTPADSIWASTRYQLNHWFIHVPFHENRFLYNDGRQLKTYIRVARK